MNPSARQPSRSAAASLRSAWSCLAVLGATFAFALASPAQSPAPTSPDPHQALLQQELYPSARQCGSCHNDVYEEWSSSAHAYAAISPMFHKFEQRISELANGTVGAFCVRCHIPVGTALGEERWRPLWQRSPVSTEGVTCIVCHRIDENFGRVNGERRIVPGPLTDPVAGASDSTFLATEVVKNRGKWEVDPVGDGRGQPVHGSKRHFANLATSEFCASCHQVAVHPGIKLEVVWEQYRDSPACAQGIRCQDCHMSTNPGLPSGFAEKPRAVVSLQPTPAGRHSDHAFVGPGYSIAHPGIFPHNRTNPYSIEQWLQFDWRAGWGTGEFEARTTGHPQFPAAWADASKRRDARRIVGENQGKIGARNEKRRQVMENGSHLDGPVFGAEPATGQDLPFVITVKNECSGHNLPSGSLGAQPEIWLNVCVTDPAGNNVWETGYLDRYGDMADLHSREVRAGTLPLDHQLFNLQTKFLTTNLKGTDREMYLPVPFDGDQLPFIRPAGVPTSVMNHPPFIRMEQRSIPPLGSKAAAFRVPGTALAKAGKYRMSIRLRSRAEPIYFMDFVGATAEMVREMNRLMVDIHPYAVEFEVK